MSKHPNLEALARGLATDWIRLRPEAEDVLAEIDRLNAALAPFQAVAKQIPEEWPSECKLFANSGPFYLDNRDPTIAEWRATLEVRRPSCNS